ncbi:TonB-dependent receptor [Hymenobacter sediminicola]|uniref:TonB-dependent receptor n=1 Tax=Hymenobacter sediminicola TaxID=2761579 RepID=A0A7G7W6C3_9BACT|nr:TonB-dependent receptor [Hymenobacter sediminicola]QNH61916.1 TonB-dependent receptor [Hymenobacter sediminicola]
MTQVFTRVFSLLLGVLLLLTQVAQGQSTGTSIAGSVSSATGDILVGATVAAIHLPSGIRRTATTDGTGQYAIPEVLAGGPYTVQVAHPGHRTQLLTNVFLVAGQTVQFPFTLAVATLAVGTRRTDRTVLESPVPVDVIDMRELLPVVPQTDLSQLLNFSVASFNSTRQTSADGADHVDPISLRGMAPDQSLVLVNGKRLHTTALINLLGSRGVGSVGYDLNTISANALDRVEVLRDGAAAQYGSDAIAGVMNFTLKSANKGGNVLLNTGITTEGDGLTGLLSLNRGLRLGQKGFLNLTADADYRGATTRHYTRNIVSWPVFSYNANEEKARLAASGKTYDDFEQVNGDAKIRNLRGMYNLRLPFTDKVAFYSFGGYNFRRGEAVAPWVLPASADADIVESIFPYGYQPNINTRIHDASGTAGFVFGLGQWSLDVSQVLGRNSLRYDISNTLNSSLGSNSPRQFDAGGLVFTQSVSNATFSRLFPKLLAGTNVAFGGEFRHDRYEIVAGEKGSYFDYAQGKEGASAGAQGFIGFDPAFAVDGTRNNVGAFADVEADVTKKWTVGTALRFENYSDFGSAFIYKVDTRLQLAKALAVRAAYNTGFRAPALQQVLYRQLTLLPTSEGARYSGLFNNQSNVARAAGIGSLRPEKSRNLSAGLVITPTASLTFTADAYQIDIDDRILLSGIFGIDTTGARPALNQALLAANADNAQFFTNAANTRTRGLDLVATYRNALGRGSLNVSLAANFNNTRIRSLQVPLQFQNLQTDRTSEGRLKPGNDYLDQRQLSLLETGNPASKLILSTGYDIKKFSVLLRNFYFGQVKSYDFNFDPLDEGSVYMVFRPKTTTDLSLSYRPVKALSLTAGVNNVFDVYPDDIMTATRNGRAPDGFKSFDEFNAYYLAKYGKPSNLPYDFDILPYQSQQMPFNGRFVYLKAVYTVGL